MSLAHDGQLPETPPSQAPDRKEVLVISSYEANTRHTRMVLYEMVRDEKGILRQLLPFSDTEGRDEQAESPLLEAFVYGFWQTNSSRREPRFRT